MQITDLNPKELKPGVIGHYAHGENVSFGYVELKAGSIIPQHTHVHEQVTYILEGQLDMEIGGKLYSLTPGCHFVIASMVSHGANAITDCKVIDVFAPVREEYRT